MIITALVFSLWELLFPVSITANKLIRIDNDSLIIVQDNSVRALNIQNFWTQTNWTKAEMIDYINIEYPDMSTLLIYMLEKESGYGESMIGDSGLAYGYFQIHIDKHDIGENCAMNFICSLEYTVENIIKGNGYLWTAYRNYYGI